MAAGDTQITMIIKLNNNIILCYYLNMGIGQTRLSRFLYETAQLAAQNIRHHKLPKFLMGKPSDVFASKMIFLPIFLLLQPTYVVPLIYSFYSW